MIKKVWSVISHFIFPSRCLLCGRVTDISNKICEECEKSLPFTGAKPLYPLGEELKKRNKRYFYCALAPFFYEGSVRKGILALKFKGRKNTADFLSSYMADIADGRIFENIDFAVCVPCSKKRLNKRGYNQSDLLARSFCEIKGIMYLENILEKTKDNPTQSNIIADKDRIKNVKKVFDIKSKELISGKKIILIDDVITSGATLNECARVLYEAGAGRIICLTAATARKVKK